MNNLIGNEKPVRVFEHGSLKNRDRLKWKQCWGGTWREEGHSGVGNWDAFSPPLIPAPNLSVPQVWILEVKTNTLTSSKHQLFSSLQSYKNESLKNKQYAVERASIRYLISIC